MAQCDPSSLTSAPVILHYGGIVLSAAITPALSRYPKFKLKGYGDDHRDAEHRSRRRRRHDLLGEHEAGIRRWCQGDV